ncbi:MAG: ATP-binding protein [Prevotella sp.]|nr:ATP-binding protein [Staphylococcus sp.]MCM1350126.1 ATP-binding protein [Prevotella sp.]
MGFILYRIETYGMKNINDKITIDFQNQTIYRKKNKNFSNIKAIYGTNGTGKSAIVHSIDLYKQIVLERNYLKQNNNIKALNKMINKVKKEFYMNVIFGLSEEEKIVHIFKHEILIKLDNNIPYIEFENFKTLQGQTINGTYNEIYSITNGDLIINEYDNNVFDQLIIEKSKNILKYATLSSLILDDSIFSVLMKEMNNNNALSEINSKTLDAMLNDFLFAASITIYLDQTDLHEERDFEDFIQHYNKYEIAYKNKIHANEDWIRKSNIEQYRKDVKKMYNFIALFKPDLKEIRVDEREDQEFIHCFKKMIYSNYEVDSDYESTGIQKLMKLFSSIEDVTKGKIVFIDELDANVNGVYLNKLLEYLKDQGKGQLCFTTHNLYPMYYLYKYSNSIDFIGETGKLVSWKKNGNYKPYTQYTEGMIVDSPFNIEPFDFIHVFESEGE